MSTQLLHGQMSVVDENGNVTIMHQETSASDVLVNNTNTNGTNGTSALPSDVTTVQKLADKLGNLAFKTKVESGDLAAGVIANNFNTTEAGHALDARAGSELNNRLETIEESDYVYLEETEEVDVTLPESEINDAVTGNETTWSSNKIDNVTREIRDIINALDIVQNFYIPLVEVANNVYTTQKTLTEIETAYQNNKSIWVIASEIFLPLRQRISDEHWLFSGYTETQTYDIRITTDGVSITYKELVTRDIVNGLQTEYDETTNTVSFI
jgi:hypothetical protein